ncbi:MAG: head-tail adaptor protein [Ignavibacteria bacterium]|nr:head-tail adaptor protein [Ignavibacteria bacterium]
MVFNYPVAYYELTFSNDTMGGQTTSQTEVIETLWTKKEELDGRELFDAQRLKYEEPRKYTCHKRTDINIGGLIYDDSKYYIIKSVKEIDNYLYELLASRYTELDA